VPSDPLAYFITFSSYGAWLHGRATGSVDHLHNEPGRPFVPVNPKLEQFERTQMKEEEYVLNPARRRIVLDTIREVCTYRGWKLLAVHVRSNHVHVVVAAPVPPEKIMNDLKAYASRRLKERLGESTITKRWTTHGSTLYLWNEESVREKIEYTLHGQGDPMELFDGSSVL
jgi:REP element-mobilizing transposase RayT